MQERMLVVCRPTAHPLIVTRRALNSGATYPMIIPKAALPGTGRMNGQSEHHLIGVPLIFPVPFLNAAPPARIVLAAARRPLVSRSAVVTKGRSHCRRVGMALEGGLGLCRFLLRAPIPDVVAPSARAFIPVAIKPARQVRQPPPNSGVVRHGLAYRYAPKDEACQRQKATCMKRQFPSSSHTPEQRALLDATAMYEEPQE